MSERDPKAVIEGLELTWEQAELLEWDDAFIDVVRKAKSDFHNVHVCEIAGDWYIVRSLNRREYRNLVQQQAELLQKEAEAQQGGNADGVRATLNMISEEAIAVQGTVFPKMDTDTIRALPSGVATTLHDTVLGISGYQNVPSPIKV
jgi:hypothetical protein